MFLHGFFISILFLDFDIFAFHWYHQALSHMTLQTHHITCLPISLSRAIFSHLPSAIPGTECTEFILRDKLLQINAERLSYFHFHFSIVGIIKFYEVLARMGKHIHAFSFDPSSDHHVSSIPDSSLLTLPSNAFCSSSSTRQLLIQCR